MMKGATKIILGIVIVLALTGGIVLLLMLPPSGGTDPSSEPGSTEAVTPTPVPYLANAESGLFKRMTVTLADGESYVVTKDDSGYVLADPLPTLTVYSTNLSSTVNAALSPIIVRDIAAGSDNAALEPYGLTKPAARVKLELTDGSGYELLIGNATPTEDGYYATRVGSGRIVTISAAQGSRLLRDKLAMHTIALFKSYTDDEGNSYTLAEKFDILTLTYPDETVLQLHLRDAEEEADDLIVQFSTYLMLQPYQGAGYDYGIQESLLTPLLSINPSSAVTSGDYDPADYGLDQAHVLTINDVEGWELTLYIGGVDAETGGRYLMIEGLESYVFLDTAGDYSFLTVKPVFFRSGILWMYNIKDVNTVLFELENETRLYTVDDNDDSITSDLDGVPLIEDNARRLYMRVIGLQATGQNTEDTPGKTVHRFTITMKSGEKHVLELKRLNDRQLEAFLDGVDQKLCLNASDVNRFYDAFSVIDAGGTLERD